MAEIATYAHMTVATLHEKTWDEAWFALQAWKGYLQSFPGHTTTDISAFPLENGDVRVFVTTHWTYPEQLEEWSRSEVSAEELLKRISPAPFDMITQMLEDF